MGKFAFRDAPRILKFKNSGCVPEMHEKEDRT